jgi:hypothetical protein
MTFLIALLINLLILALIVVVVIWVLGLVAGSLGLPPNVIQIIKAILILIALLIFISMITGGWTGFYSPHLVR